MIECLEKTADVERDGAAVSLRLNGLYSGKSEINVTLPAAAAGFRDTAISYDGVGQPLGLKPSFVWHRQKVSVVRENAAIESSCKTDRPILSSTVFAFLGKNSPALVVFQKRIERMSSDTSRIGYDGLCFSYGYDGVKVRIAPD
jgi:hypothetical protein